MGHAGYSGWPPASTSDEEQKKEFHSILEWADETKSFVVFGEEDQTYGRFETDILLRKCLLRVGYIQCQEWFVPIMNARDYWSGKRMGCSSGASVPLEG